MYTRHIFWSFYAGIYSSKSTPGTQHQYFDPTLATSECGLSIYYIETLYCLAYIYTHIRLLYTYVYSGSSLLVHIL